MKNKGQSLALGIWSSLFILVAGIVLLNFLLPEIDNTRVALSCSNPNIISDGTKIFCLMTDATVPYWIIIIFSLVIGGITSRLSL